MLCRFGDAAARCPGPPSRRRRKQSETRHPVLQPERGRRSRLHREDQLNETVYCRPHRTVAVSLCNSRRSQLPLSDESNTPEEPAGAGYHNGFASIVHIARHLATGWGSRSASQAHRGTCWIALPIHPCASAIHPSMIMWWSTAERPLLLRNRYAALCGLPVGCRCRGNHRPGACQQSDRLSCRRQ
jgi:hypothetical protein